VTITVELGRACRALLWQAEGCGMKAEVPKMAGFLGAGVELVEDVELVEL
jgi:hypothetical protein